MKTTEENLLPIRIVFLGTPMFSVPTLDALLSDPRFDILGVVTQPDKPSGRGQKLMPTPVKQRALEAGLPVFQPKFIRKDETVLAWLRAQAPDFLVTIAFGQILSQDVLDIPKRGTINVHASLLPKLRGANPIQQAILQGDAETGITTMLTDIGVDTGDMLLKIILPIGPDETTGELAIRMAQAGGPLLIETLVKLHAGAIQPIPQPHNEATHAPKQDKADAAIDWAQPAQKIHNHIRAYNPAPGAYTELDGQRFKILRSRLLPSEDRQKAEEILKTSEPGQIGAIMKEGVLVMTTDSPLLVTRLQPAGKKEMDAADWARGALAGHTEPNRFISVIERQPHPTV